MTDLPFQQYSNRLVEVNIAGILMLNDPWKKKFMNEIDPKNQILDPPMDGLYMNVYKH